MAMRQNPIKQKLLAGEPVFGAQKERERVATSLGPPHSTGDEPAEEAPAARC